jgi:hypothetical protein
MLPTVIGRAPLALLLVALTFAGCARKNVEQRTTEGLSAEQMFIYRALQQNGREPTWEERRTWQDDLDLRISRYLNEHPEVANSYAVTKFRSLRQSSVGMTQEQVEILLGSPDEKTTDTDRLEKIARKYWPRIQGRAREAWLYPLGWNFYFGDGTLVDITQYLDD